MYTNIYALRNIFAAEKKNASDCAKDKIGQNKFSFSFRESFRTFRTVFPLLSGAFLYTECVIIMFIAQVCACFTFLVWFRHDADSATRILTGDDLFIIIYNYVTTQPLCSSTLVKTFFFYCTT